MKPCEQVLSVSVNENWKHIELQDVLDCLKHLYGANRILLIIIIIYYYSPTISTVFYSIIKRGVL